MVLPNGGRAVVDIAKLRDYCLSPDHPRGKHKARVFAAVLGLTADQTDVLRDALLVAAAMAVSSDARSIATMSDTHQPASVPALDPFAITAGSSDARNTACNANEMSAARIAHAAVRLR